jgi:hypothetical protein
MTLNVSRVGSPDKSERVEVTSQDVLRWEKSGRGRRMAQLSQTSIQDSYQLAYFACLRTHLFEGTLAEFIDGHQLDLAVDDSAVDEAIRAELVEWREVLDNVDPDEFARQLDERIAELGEEGGEDPTR